PRSDAYFVFPLAQGTPGKQCGLAATGVYQPSLRSPWLAASEAFACSSAIPQSVTLAPTAIVSSRVLCWPSKVTSGRLSPFMSPSMRRFLLMVISLSRRMTLS
ncbi:hypothetical protein, partial [Thiolapillus sp.]|uniref:hypothetical protein n=1 Tax=Thiolapillus sp. TaxID=2017437 RepID=UPI003AF6A01E